MANEFVIKNGFISKGDGQIENNLNVNGEFESSGLIKTTAINTAANQNPVITNTSVLRVSGSGGTDTPTIPNGVSGQRLTLYCVSFPGGRITYSPLTGAGWSSFEMGALGDSIDLIYDSLFGWVILGNRGGSIT